MNIHRSSARFCPQVLVLLCLLLAAGCSSGVTQSYGESDGYVAKCSPGGLTVFRSMVEERGLKTYTIRSLSPTNSDRLESIVWCPDMFPTHNRETTDWMQNWLALGGKTLIYIGRDFSPHAAYWNEVAARARTIPGEAERIIPAEEKAAREEVLLDGMRRANRNFALTPWFRWDLDGGAFVQFDALDGPLSEGIGEGTSRIWGRSRIAPLRPKDLPRLRSQLDWQEDQGSSPSKPTSSKNVYERQWSYNDTNQREILDRISETDVLDWEPLLTGPGGEVIVGEARLGPNTSSRVVVINNASLVCNYGMLSESHRVIASSMIDEFAYGGVGFLTGTRDPLIRSDDKGEQQQGFEMLTTWPLNVVTIHAAFLGLAAIFAAYPIFGRPTRLPTKSTSDFGQHIDAVGELMKQSGDQAYAAKQIADYFRIVRGDTSSPWATLDLDHTPTQSPFKTIPPVAASTGMNPFPAGSRPPIASPPQAVASQEVAPQGAVLQGGGEPPIADAPKASSPDTRSPE